MVSLKADGSQIIKVFLMQLLPKISRWVFNSICPFIDFIGCLLYFLMNMTFKNSMTKSVDAPGIFTLMTILNFRELRVE
ncbi:MAG TPA: hypothetical protein VGF79_13855 [Bacteroidia bacterium]